jgi:glycerophosphoryl diester phosphodiesterase
MSGKPVLVIAHRGGRKWAPENTLAAFRKSVEAKCDAVELDIHRCASGELVVIHDDDLKRTTNGAGLVKDATYAELKRLSAGEWFSPEFVSEKIPTLQQVFDLVDGKLIINVEIKNQPVEYPGIEDDLIELLAGYKHRDKIVVSSFDHKVLQKFHSKCSDIPVGLLADAVFYDLHGYAAKVGATLWHPSLDCLREDDVYEAKRGGMGVNVWTVNEPRDWSHAMKMGVDGICSDDPVGLIAFVEQVSKVRS